MGTRQRVRNNSLKVDQAPPRSPEPGNLQAAKQEDTGDWPGLLSMAAGKVAFSLASTTGCPAEAQAANEKRAAL